MRSSRFLKGVGRSLSFFLALVQLQGAQNDSCQFLEVVFVQIVRDSTLDGCDSRCFPDGT